MSKIVENYAQVLKDVSLLSKDKVTVVVVSKNQSVESMETLYRNGVLDFGENRVAEALLKKEQLPGDVRLHLIGPLQKNKVRKAVGNFVLIHSVDSFELAQKISEVSKEKECQTSILLQINISKEASKQGLTEDECLSQFEKFNSLESIDIQGLMTMAPLTEDTEFIRQTFRKLKALLDKINQQRSLKNPLKELSMGMSHDYKIALEEGATIVRVGSLIFN